MSDSDWDAFEAPVPRLSNFTITGVPGPSTGWPVLGLGFVRGKLLWFLSCFAAITGQWRDNAAHRSEGGGEAGDACERGRLLLRLLLLRLLRLLLLRLALQDELALHMDQLPQQRPSRGALALPLMRVLAGSAAAGRSLRAPRALAGGVLAARRCARDGAAAAALVRRVRRRGRRGDARCCCCCCGGGDGASQLLIAFEQQAHDAGGGGGGGGGAAAATAPPGAAASTSIDSPPPGATVAAVAVVAVAAAAGGGGGAATGPLYDITTSTSASITSTKEAGTDLRVTLTPVAAPAAPGAGVLGASAAPPPAAAAAAVVRSMAAGPPPPPSCDVRRDGALLPPGARPPAAVAAAPVGSGCCCGGCGGSGLRRRTSGWLCSRLQVLGRCQHPNIVRLLAACLKPPRLCLVMELMDTSLERLVHGKAGDLMPLQTVLHVAADIARGLAYLHPTIVHRDLKPGNVLLSNLESMRPIAKLTRVPVPYSTRVTGPALCEMGW
ncbi:Serine/threonine-protein kinase HT1 [Tetrabaena socialis]|uniref:Serine/threonine-protein kinase HT1 n=1 Tax=Tetrabaena socialis TaxID=47790 RepID=A0A2J7ZRK8_9CHLO|nr:Serine/threonine-protein kinase HT1 [Tetrabaena socialis]|eukprot:PNH02905.1 Serine/threonine-protein kinase HT1 [Tetrabaena socialis]